MVSPYRTPNYQRITEEVTPECYHRGYPINPERGGCIVPILDLGINIMLHMLSKRERTLFLAFTLTLPKGFVFKTEKRTRPDGTTYLALVSPVSQFLDSLKNANMAGKEKKEKGESTPNRPVGFWVVEVSDDREFTENCHPIHWHFACFFDGHKNRSARYILDEMIRLWCKAVNAVNATGFLHYKKKIDDEEVIAQEFFDEKTIGEKRRGMMCNIVWWLSYISKVETKENLPKGLRKFSKFGVSYDDLRNTTGTGNTVQHLNSNPEEPPSLFSPAGRDLVDLDLSFSTITPIF